jgi:2'-phosphotransferase
MTRTHIHFASGLPAGFKSVDEEDGEKEKQPVISGMRNSSSVLVYLDAEKALNAGLKLWRSANGVILCDGNEDRIIPVDLFKRVEERKKAGGVLLRDGKVVESK